MGHPVYDLKWPTHVEVEVIAEEVVKATKQIVIKAHKMNSDTFLGCSSGSIANATNPRPHPLLTNCWRCQHHPLLVLCWLWWKGRKAHITTKRSAKEKLPLLFQRATALVSVLMTDTLIMAALLNNITQNMIVLSFNYQTR